MKNDDFFNVLTEEQGIAWDALKAVIEEFLGKHRHSDYAAYVRDMLDAFWQIDVNMSLKIHFMNSHLELFASQLPSESDEQGEKFHQIAKPFEENYKGKELRSMVTDLCWSLIDEKLHLNAMSFRT